jgi:hypothetical protein
MAMTQDTKVAKFVGGRAGRTLDPSFRRPSSRALCMEEAKSHRYLLCLSVRQPVSCDCACHSSSLRIPPPRANHGCVSHPIAELYSARRSFLNMDARASIVAAQSRLLRLCRNAMTPFARISVEVIHNISNATRLPSCSGVSGAHMA